MKLEYSKIIEPLMGFIEESGDLIYVYDNNTLFNFAVIDALGHGSEAYDVAITALKYLEDNGISDPATTLEAIHMELLQSRGAVIGLGSINKETGELITCGLGNIVVKIVGRDSKKIFFRDGIVGYSKPSLQNQYLKLQVGDILLMYSDGIKEYFDILDIPDINLRSSHEVAATIIKNYSKSDDDASILTIKMNYD